MKPTLKRIKVNLYRYKGSTRIDGAHSRLYGNCSGLYGDCTRLSGDCTRLSGKCTGLSGNCSWLYGDLDKCEITGTERARGINITELVKEQER